MESFVLLNSCVRGYHEYRSIWDPVLRSKYLCQREPNNEDDKFAVAVMNNGAVVGHIPKKISQPISRFLETKESSVVCEVTGGQQFTRDHPRGGLEIPCNYNFFGEKEAISVLKRNSKIKEEESYTLEQAFQTAVQKRGSWKVNLAHYIPFGPPKVGKTCLLRRLVDKVPLGTPATINGPYGSSCSTDALEDRKTIHVSVQTGSQFEPTAVVADNIKWSEVEDINEETAILVKTLASRPDAFSSSSQPNSSAFSNQSSPSLKIKTSPVTVNSDASSQLVTKLTKKAVKNRDMDEVQELLDNSMTLYCTDTGGQPEFQEVLPALVAGPIIFLFIFNLLKSLDSTYEVKYNSAEQEGHAYTSSYTVKHVLMQFLSSIASYHSTISRSFTQETRLPPPSVITIGTHKDLMSEPDSIEEIDENLKQLFETVLQMNESINLEYHNDNELIIPIDNYSQPNDSNSVRRVVERVVKRDCNVEIPVPWLALELFLRSLPCSVVKYTECQAIAAEYNISDEELSQCLNFLHHRTGTIRYYSDVDELKEIIITKPSILFCAVSKLITSTFTIENVQNAERNRFQKLGLFKTSTVECIFNKHSSKLEITLEAFLALLQYLYILGPSHDNSLGDYFLPCALVHAPESDDISTSTCVDPLLLVFGCGFVPKGFFSSLLAYLCQKGWKIACKPRRKPCLFRNESSFYVDVEPNPSVKLKLRASMEYLEISIQQTEKPPRKFFHEVHKIISEGISNICISLRYDESVSKPQFGFYCNDQSCSSNDIKHFAVVEEMKVRCAISNKSTMLEAERNIWFEAIEPTSTIMTDVTDLQSTSATVEEQTDNSMVTSNTDGKENEQRNSYVKTQPKKDEVFNLVKIISASWYELARELDISTNYRDSLKQDGGLSDDTRLEKILEKWITSETKPVTWEVIINALESLERIDLVKKIKMYLIKPQKRVSSHDEELHVHVPSTKRRPLTPLRN